MYQQALTKCAQFHWRNVKRKILSYLRCDCCCCCCFVNAYNVNAFFLFFEFWYSSYLSLWLRCSEIYTIMSKILWPFYCYYYYYLSCIFSILLPFGLTCDYDIGWAFKLSVIGKKKKEKWKVFFIKTFNYWWKKIFAK